MSRTKDRRGYRLFKPEFNDRDGKRRETARWYAEFRDHREKVRRLPLFSSRQASEDAAKMLVRLVADVQVNGRMTDPDVTRWVDGLPLSLRLRLSDAEVPRRGRGLNKGATRPGIGLITTAHTRASQSINDHMADFSAALLAKGTSPAQAAMVRGRIVRIAKGCKFTTIGDISAGRVSAYLAELRRGSDADSVISQRTSNFYAQSVGQFCRWLVRERRLHANPLAGMEKLKITDAQKRRALDVEEQRWLIDTTADGPDRVG